MNEIQRLHAALAPFQAEFKRWLAHSGQNSPTRRDWNQKMPDDFPIKLRLTMGDYRKAVAAYESIKRD